MKTLISYKSLPIHFFGDSWEFPYELTIEDVSFFGLVKRIKKVRYVVSMFQSIKEHTEHWDKLIATKEPLK